MTRFTRLTILSAMTLGLAACGGAKLGGGKEGAAQAAFQASQPAGRGNTKTGSALLEKALASGATTVSVSIDCAQGGEASLALDLTGGTQGSILNYTITYDACNEDGQNEYNGTMATSITVPPATPGTLGALTFGMKGKLTIDGDISDFIDADVRLTMAVTASSTHSGSVTIVTDGTIKTSDSTYTYNHETLTLTAGELPKG